MDGKMIRSTTRGPIWVALFAAILLAAPMVSAVATPPRDPGLLSTSRRLIDALVGPQRVGTCDGNAADPTKNLGVVERAMSAVWPSSEPSTADAGIGDPAGNDLGSYDQPNPDEIAQKFATIQIALDDPRVADCRPALLTKQKLLVIAMGGGDFQARGITNSIGKFQSGVGKVEKIFTTGKRQVQVAANDIQDLAPSPAPAPAVQPPSAPANPGSARRSGSASAQATNAAAPDQVAAAPPGGASDFSNWFYKANQPPNIMVEAPTMFFLTLQKTEQAAQAELDKDVKSAGQQDQTVSGSGAYTTLIRAKLWSESLASNEVTINCPDAADDHWQYVHLDPNAKNHFICSVQANNPLGLGRDGKPRKIHLIWQLQTCVGGDTSTDGCAGGHFSEPLQTPDPIDIGVVVTNPLTDVNYAIKQFQPLQGALVSLFPVAGLLGFNRKKVSAWVSERMGGKTPGRKPEGSAAPAAAPRKRKRRAGAPADSHPSTDDAAGGAG